MRAIGFTEFGGPEVLRVLDLPEPQPKAGEIRVRVHAASVNPTDLSLRSGRSRERFGGRPGPYVPGMDAAGTVDAIGPDTDTALHVGDPVVAVAHHYRGNGAYADLLVVPARSVVPIPDGADFPSASTLLMNALTGRIALDRVAVPAGGTVAVTGAAGAFGDYAVQLAKADGLRVLADASAADTELVAALGADEVLPRGDDLADRLRAIEPAGVDAVLDGAMLHERGLPAIADNGGLVTIRGWQEPVPRGITVHPVSAFDFLTDHAALLRLRDQASAGRLTLRVADVLPAERAAEAHRRLAAGGVRGRIVLDFAQR